MHLFGEGFDQPDVIVAVGPFDDKIAEIVMVAPMKLNGKIALPRRARIAFGLVVAQAQEMVDRLAKFSGADVDEVFHLIPKHQAIDIVRVAIEVAVSCVSSGSIFSPCVSRFPIWCVTGWAIRET